ncbi:MAG: hypothetical protein E6Q46_02405 [Flavobacterium sp.]|nr:MAG: hypothetical protein E6Q46_02405 [Flavobacterium sp.]
MIYLLPSLLYKKYLKVFFITFFFLQFYQLHSQELNSNSDFFKTVSYGKKVYFGEIESAANWTVISPNNKTTTILYGNEINNFNFKEPGVYTIFFSDVKKFGPNDCVHPKFKDKMLINVTPTEMVFQFSKIQFSDKIRVGKNCDDILMTLPVTINSLSEGGKVKLLKVNVTGNDVNLIAMPLQEEIIVKNGTYNLSYKLSGTVNKETYLMFDFVDNNNETQTYYQLEIVN